MINTLRRGLFTLCALVAMSTAPASATPTWTFTGTCSDCPDIGEGVLTTTIISNFTYLSFSYVSDWISYTMPNPAAWVDGDSIDRAVPFTPPSGLSLFLFESGIDVTSFGGVGNPLAAGVYNFDVEFSLGSNGNWSTGPSVPFDFGINGAFTAGSSAVPEPSTLGLAGLSAGLLLLGQWRRRKA